jgi:molecular chaperone DnaJ
MAAMNEKDYYAILGVEKTATTQEIRKAFQQKARQLHPDVNKAPDAEERFKEVSEAYAVLSDDEKRRRYDAMRSGVPFAGTSTSYGGTQGSYGGYGGYGSADPFGWGFPFGAYGSYRRQTSSARRPRSYNPTAGADIVYQLQLDEKEASAGVRRGVTYQRYVSCDACHGTGSVHSEHPETCPTCKGRGRISVDLSDILFGVMDMVCPECQGTGQVVADPCSTCGGAGRVLTASEVVVDVPAGSHDGDTVRISGRGNAGTNGEASGDFVCHISVPAEQLSPTAQVSYRLIGMFAPFLVLYATTLQNLLGTVGVLAAIALVVGLATGGFKHGSYWWRNAIRMLASGVSSTLPIALFFLMLRACNAVMFSGVR